MPHTNHRNRVKVRRRVTRPVPYCAPGVGLTFYKRLASGRRRTKERCLIAAQRFEDLPTRFPRNILWHYY
jgi:hypothetical protein